MHHRLNLTVTILFALYAAHCPHYVWAQDNAGLQPPNIQAAPAGENALLPSTSVTSTAPMKPEPVTPGTSSPSDAAATAAATMRGPTGGLGAITRSTVRPLDTSVGQYWAEYDLRPYTKNLPSDARPEQAIIDWIVRETGTDIWFHEPMGILSASRDKIAVYHNEGVHASVKKVYEQFVNGNIDPQSFTIRILLVGSPNWRTSTISWMRSVDVKSPGVQGWLLNKEQNAMLLATMRSRSDSSEIAAPKLSVVNGQLQTIENLRTVSYVRGYERREQPYPSYVPISDSILEGYRIKMSPLMSIDERTIDMSLSCSLDQVEKLNPVPVDLPTANGSLQSVQITIPQMMSWRFDERFIWPSDHILVLSCGVVAPPAESTRSTLLNAQSSPGLLGLGKLVPPPPAARADALLTIEYNGRAEKPETSQPSTTPESTATVAPRSAAVNPISRGRY